MNETDRDRSHDHCDKDRERKLEQDHGHDRGQDKDRDYHDQRGMYPRCIAGETIMTTVILVLERPQGPVL